MAELPWQCFIEFCRVPTKLLRQIEIKWTTNLTRCGTTETLWSPGSGHTNSGSIPCMRHFCPEDAVPDADDTI